MHRTVESRPICLAPREVGDIPNLDAAGAARGRWSHIVAAAGIALALVLGGGNDARATQSEQTCRLPERMCASEGVVLIARHAHRLVGWRRTDFWPIDLRWFRLPPWFRDWFLDALGPERTVTLLVGPKDLWWGRIGELAHAIHERGGSVILTDPTLDDADRLRRLLGVSGAAWGEDEGRARLYGLREVIDDGLRHATSFVLFQDPERRHRAFHRRHRQSLDRSETAWLLARIGASPPVLDDAGPPLLGSTTNNLYTLAKATMTSTKKSRGGQSIELENSVIAARALDPTKWSDFYAVKQQAIGYPCAGQTQMSFGAVSGLDPDNSEIVVQQPLPGDVGSGDRYETGVDFPFAGAVGYPTTSTGFDVASSNAEIQFSVTTNLPSGASIMPQSTPLDWQLTATNPPTAGTTLSTSWLWIASAAAYAPDEGQLTFDTTATMDGSTCSSLSVTASLTTVLDRPFPTTDAEDPVVQQVVPGNVVVGAPFTITGTGFYPSIITAVKVAGEELSTTEWKANSYKEITVTAPSVPPDEVGVPLAVEVDTTSGSSNSTINIVITNG